MILALLLTLAQAGAPVPSTTASTVGPSPEDRIRIGVLARLPLAAPTDASYGQIREGLKHAHPSVRAAAARVAHIFGGTAVLPELVAALKVETDIDPARELTWAVANLDSTPGSDDLLVEVVSRPSIGPRLFSAVVAGQGSRFLSLWTRLKPLIEHSPGGIPAGLELGLHGDTATPFVSFALRDGMEDLFERLVGNYSMKMAPAVLTMALSSESSRVRTAAALRIAEDGVPLAADTLSSRPAPVSSMERVAMLLMEAAQHPGRADGLETLIAQLKKETGDREAIRVSLSGRRFALRGLTAPQREDLYRALDFDKTLVDSVRSLSFPLPRIDATPSEPIPVFKTLGGYPDDYVRSVLETSDCVAKAGVIEGVDVTWRPGGRPLRVRPLESAGGSSTCRDAAIILGATTLSGRGDRRAAALLPVRPEFLACLAQPASTPGLEPELPGRAGSGRTKEPTKTRNVNPVYPATSKSRRVQGLVIFDAEVGKTGCVGAVRILRGVDGELDMAGLDAVSGWAYTQTLVDGSPVPVTMTLTVNFRLNF